MEFEDVSEQIQREARRVAAAFGIKEWDEQGESCGDLFLSSRKGDVQVRCCIDSQGRLFDLHIENAQDPTTFYCDVEFQPELYCVPCLGNPSYNEVMARGLYRLGTDAPTLISELPSLSNHEKLELRLSMPCEFWPKTWLDQEEERS